MDREDSGEGTRVTPSVGAAGGTAPAAAWEGSGAAGARPLSWIEHLRWGPVWAGVLVAMAAELVLWMLGLGAGLYRLTPTASGAAPSLGSISIWSGVWALVALFIGGYTASALAGSATGTNAARHGVVVWALALVASALLAAFGVAGVFGFIAIRAAVIPGLTPGDVTGTAWGFFIGALVSLAGAAIGGFLGKQRRADPAEPAGT